MKQIKQSVVVLVAILLSSSAAFAIPVLQLGIAGGSYDDSPGVETIIAPGNIFKLYAYLNPNVKNKLGDTYYLSMAVSPQYGPAGGDLGSFLFNGSPINVTGDMFYGVPPLEATLASGDDPTAVDGADDPGDLPGHGLFPTYFAERSFTFLTTPESALFNTQDASSDFGTSGPRPGTGMYYQEFDIDVTNLDPGYVIHFDLYNAELKGKKLPLTDLDITQFAPFSHDAQSTPSTSVPEPTSLLLLGAGLAAMGLFRRLH